RAAAAVLRSNGLLTAELDDRLQVDVDLAGYADAVLQAGRLREFAAFGPPPSGAFFARLAAGLADGLAVPEVLNVVERLVVPREQDSARSAGAIALTAALAIADALRGRARWDAAGVVYGRAAALAAREEAPGVQWRAWL